MAREVRELTVLFADICGSTRLYHALGDEAARSLVEAGLAEIAVVLPEQGGRLVKTIGDEVMCTFDDPDRAVQAAAMMQTRIIAAQPMGRRLDIHIGLHHGPVLLESRDVFGDTVNAASYLCAVATAGQVLITDSTYACLSNMTKAMVRPVFFARLKGSNVESKIYQVLWQSDPGTLTHINLHSHNLMPPDQGTVIIMAGNREIRIDPKQPTITLGRGSECDIRVADAFASRRHALVTLRRTQVFLTDVSSNGTYIRRASGELAHLFRSELLLDGEGEISLGRAFDQLEGPCLQFRRDRRALFRV
jgi:class 3 adenylate cyclase